MRASLTRFEGCLLGDVDTIAAMAGAIWGARNGVERLPGPQLACLEDADGIRSIAGKLYQRFGVERVS